MTQPKTTHPSIRSTRPDAISEPGKTFLERILPIVDRHLYRGGAQ